MGDVRKLVGDVRFCLSYPQLIPKIIHSPSSPRIGTLFVVGDVRFWRDKNGGFAGEAEILSWVMYGIPLTKSVAEKRILARQKPWVMYGRLRQKTWVKNGNGATEIVGDVRTVYDKIDS